MGGRAGRFDILVADPHATLTTRGEITRIAECDAQGRWQARESAEDPLALVRALLGPIETLPPEVQALGLPFFGGALGWFSYDLARRIERLPSLAEDAEDLPDMAIGVYDWAVVVDHQRQQSWLAGAGRHPLTAVRWPELRDSLQTLSGARISRVFSGFDSRERASEHAAGSLSNPDFRLLGPLETNLDQRQYAAAFTRVQDYIRAGDCYQVNLARRFEAPVVGDPWQAYLALRRLNPAPFAAYLDLAGAQILSSSPERFLSLSERRVRTQPIKGTRPRGEHPAQDLALAADLAGSPKDRAENLMIVDLLRNDLGRVCRPGTVRVPELFAIEPFAAVHHLVSTVTGRLAAGEDACSLLRACFPGGSITGAPKIRAMEIIEELEPHRRGLYCGAIGYLGFDGCMDTNIAIRTLVHSQGRLRFWSGGGLVHDSKVELEFEETLHKAAPLLRLLESLARQP